MKEQPHLDPQITTATLDDSLNNLTNYLTHKYQDIPHKQPTNNLTTTNDPQSMPTNQPSPHIITSDHHDNVDTTTQHTPTQINRPSSKSRPSHDSSTCLNPNCYPCAQDNIVNLSGITLTKPQITILSKGLSFVPTANHISPRELIKNINDFAQHTKTQYLRYQKATLSSKRKRDIRFYPRSKQNNQQSLNTRLGPKPLEDAFQVIKSETTELNLETTPPLKYNLTRKEHKALKELAENHNIVCNRADKGSTITVIHRKDYIREGLEHLSDTNTYLPLDGDYTSVIAEIIRETLKHLLKEGLLTLEMVEFCQPPIHPRPAQLYFLKKIHKPSLDFIKF